MSYSITQYSPLVPTSIFSVVFPYISQSHVQVRVNNTLLVNPTDYTWLSPSQIQLVAPRTLGDVIDIRRLSNRAARLVDFQNSAKITEAVLDLDGNQGFYVSQEALDTAEQSMLIDTDSKFDAQGKIIKNVADGVDLQDAVTVAQLNAAAVAPATVGATGAALLVSATSAIARAVLSAYSITQVDALDAANVKLTGNQTVAGVKTFSNHPVITGGSVFRKNAIINGDPIVWQEGTSFAAMANSTYIADNWRYNKSGAMVHTGSQSTDVPTIAQAGRKIPYSLLIDCTTVDSSIAAADYAMVTTFIEGSNFVNIAGVGLCCQFWHKHTKTGTYCVAFINSGNDRSFVREYTQAVTDTWELATVLVDASPTAGTWNYTNGIGLQAHFVLTAGTLFHGAAGSWNTGQNLSTANQVNACDNVANNFMLTGVQLEKGSVATEFDVQTFEAEIEFCKWFFRKSFSYATAPATNAGDLDAAWSFSQIVGAGVGQFGNRIPLGGSMRAAPTITLYNPSAANSSVRNIQRGSDATNGTISPAHNGVDFDFTASAGSAAGDRNAVHWTANARF